MAIKIVSKGNKGIKLVAGEKTIAEQLKEIMKERTKDARIELPFKANNFKSEKILQNPDGSEVKVEEATKGYVPLEDDETEEIIEEEDEDEPDKPKKKIIKKIKKRK